jgi:hypothetical protein
LVRSLSQLFAEARAPLVARFDADDICMPERLERQVAFLAANPDHGLVACETTFIDAAGAPAGNAPIRRPHDHDAILAVLEAGPILCHSAVMVRTDLVRAAGGYREAYVHAEDYDLWLRLAGQTRMANLPEYLLCLPDFAWPGEFAPYGRSSPQRGQCLAGAPGARAATGVDRLPRLATPEVEALDSAFGAGSAACATPHDRPGTLCARVPGGRSLASPWLRIADAGASPAVARGAAPAQGRLSAPCPAHRCRTDRHAA